MLNLDLIHVVYLVYCLNIKIELREPPEYVIKHEIVCLSLDQAKDHGVPLGDVFVIDLLLQFFELFQNIRTFLNCNLILLFFLLFEGLLLLFLIEPREVIVFPLELLDGLFNSAFRHHDSLLPKVL